MADRRCDATGCELPHVSRGWCQRHYYEFVKKPRFQDEAIACAAPECERGARTRGYCDMHYQRLRKGGSLDVQLPARRVGVEPCSMPDCALPMKARELCAKHLSRVRRRGAPDARLRAAVVDGKRICPTCGDDVPLDQWAQRRDGRYIKCRPCHLEEYRGRNQQRRARLLGGVVEKFSRAEILERDGWVCQLCARPIDREAKWPEPLSASLDHIVPLSLGGDHTRANTQASHFRCNVSKGNRVSEVAA